MHVLDALGNPVRRHLLEQVATRPRTVGELADGLPISRPAVSRHLRVLEDAGLVALSDEGRRRVVHLDRMGFDAARAYLDAFWDDALARFALLADNLETP